MLAARAQGVESDRVVPEIHVELLGAAVLPQPFVATIDRHEVLLLADHVPFAPSEEACRPRMNSPIRSSWMLARKPSASRSTPLDSARSTRPLLRTRTGVSPLPGK